MHFVKPSQSEISLTKTYFFNSGIFARCCTFIAVAAIFSPLAITTGVAGDAATMPSVENGGTLPYQRADLPVEERVKDLVGRMTFEEKARLHVQHALYLGIFEFPVEPRAKHRVDYPKHQTKT